MQRGGGRGVKSYLEEVGYVARVLSNPEPLDATERDRSSCDGEELPPARVTQYLRHFS